MRSTPIILDRLAAALEKQGVKMKRTALLETAAAAFGYHNVQEFAANDDSGKLQPPHAIVMGQVTIGDETLVVLRDPTADAPYAIDASFIEGPVENERRELFGPSPYGGLINLSDVAGHPATVWGAAEPSATNGSPFLAFDGADHALGGFADAQTAKEACELATDEYGKTDLDSYYINVEASVLHERRTCWRATPLDHVGADQGARVAAAALLFIQRGRTERVENSLQSTLNIDVPDWKSWEKSLKKASHKGQPVLSDELLHQFRHAVADVTCKSTSGEKHEVEYRQQRYVSKHLGGLLARLDRAEDALREAGLAPADIERKSKSDAAEQLAAIEAVTTRRKDLKMPNMYEVDASHDGDKCREIFVVEKGQDPEDRGREIAAAQFRMDLEDYRYPEAGSPDEEVDEDGTPIPDYSNFDSECDTFEVTAVKLPEAAAIIGDALLDLSSVNFQYGMPHDHPVRIKLLGAIDKLRPKATV